MIGDCCQPVAASTPPVAADLACRAQDFIISAKLALLPISCLWRAPTSQSIPGALHPARRQFAECARSPTPPRGTCPAIPPRLRAPVWPDPAPAAQHGARQL